MKIGKWKSLLNQRLQFIFFLSLIIILVDINLGIVFSTNSNTENIISQDKASRLSVAACHKGLSNPSPATPIPGTTLPVIADLDFEGDDINTAWEWGGAEYQQTSTTSHRLESIPKGSVTPQSPANDQNILKVYVESSDCINNGARAEVVLNSLELHLPPTPPSYNTAKFLPNDDTWFHWYALFPDSPNPNPLEVPDTWHIVTQMHGEYWQPYPPNLCHNSSTPVQCGLVPIGFNLQNSSKDGDPLPVLFFNVLDQNNPSDRFETLWSTKENGTNTFMFNHWYEILLHVIWQPCTAYDPNMGECTQNNKGLIQLWVDGIQKINATDRYTMATIYDTNSSSKIGPPDPVYFKQGLYHCTTHPHGSSNCKTNATPPNQTIYYDGTVVALCDNPKQKIFHPATHSCKSVSSPYP